MLPRGRHTDKRERDIQKETETEPERKRKRERERGREREREKLLAQGTYVYIRTYVYTYISSCTIRVYISIYMLVRVCMYEFTKKKIYVCLHHAYKDMSLCVWVWVCLYVCVAGHVEDLIVRVCAVGGWV